MPPDDSAIKRPLSILANASDNQEQLNDNRMEEDKDAISSTSSTNPDKNKLKSSPSNGNPVHIDVDAIVVENQSTSTNNDNNILHSSSSNKNLIPITIDAIIVENPSTSSNNDKKNILKRSSNDNENSVPIDADTEALESNDKILVSVGIQNNAIHYQEESDDDYQSSEYFEDDDQQTTVYDQGNQRNLVSHQIADPQQIQKVLNDVDFINDGGVNVEGQLKITKGNNIHVGNCINKNFNAPPTIIYSKSTIVKNDNKQDIEYRQHNGNGSINNNTNENQFVTLDRKQSITSSDQKNPSPNRKAIIVCFWTKRCAVSIFVAGLILIIFTILALYLTGVINVSSVSSTSSDKPNNSSNASESSTSSDEPNNSSEGSESSTLPNQPNDPPDDDYLEIVTREEWGARNLENSPEKLKQLPPPYVIIVNTITNFCYNKTQCIEYVKYTQEYQMDLSNFDDIAYNFLVGGDGNIYEGRGWDFEGEHTEGYNSRSICIAFIGRFDRTVSIEPTKSQVEAAYKLLEFGLKNKKLTADYKLLGQKQVMISKLPGHAIYIIIKQHDHWSPIL